MMSPAAVGGGGIFPAEHQAFAVVLDGVGEVFGEFGFGRRAELGRVGQVGGASGDELGDSPGALGEGGFGVWQVKDDEADGAPFVAGVFAADGAGDGLKRRRVGSRVRRPLPRRGSFRRTIGGRRSGFWLRERSCFPSHRARTPSSFSLNEVLAQIADVFLRDNGGDPALPPHDNGRARRRPRAEQGEGFQKPPPRKRGGKGMGRDGHFGQL